MCGIFGRILSESKKPIGDTVLDILRHRGPDQDIRFEFDVAGYQIECGQTRLTIVNSSYQLEDSGPVILLFNGEIWNIQFIKNQLSLNQNLSEFEVIRAAYLQWGPSFVSRLDGDYAIAIIDKVEGWVHLYRDPVGVKPLFFWVDDHQFAFASDIKSLTQMNLADSYQANGNYWLNQFVFGFSDSTDLMIDGIELIPAGHQLSLNLDDFSVSTRHVHSLPTAPKSIAPESTLALLTQALVKRYQHSESRPIALLLSGGVDSSLLAFLAKHLNFDKIICFFIGEEDSEDYRWAKIVSEKTGYPLHTIHFDAHNSQNLAEKHGYYSPFSHQPPYLFYLFSEIRRLYPEIKVVWCGEGADELFGGYTFYADPQTHIESIKNRLNYVGSDTQLARQFLTQFDPNHPDCPTENLLSFYFSHQLEQNHLIPFDMDAMAFGLEVRLPFLDHPLIQSVNRAQIKQELEQKKYKFALKKILQTLSRIQDPKFYHRPKTGLSTVGKSYAQAFHLDAPSTPLDWLFASSLAQAKASIIQHLYTKEKRLTYNKLSRSVFPTDWIIKVFAKTIGHHTFPLAKKYDDWISNTRFEPHISPLKQMESFVNFCQAQLTQTEVAYQLLEFEWILFKMTNFYDLYFNDQDPGKRVPPTLNTKPKLKQNIILRQFNYDFLQFPQLNLKKTWMVFSPLSIKTNQSVFKISEPVFDLLQQANGSKSIEQLRTITQSKLGQPIQSQDYLNQFTSLYALNLFEPTPTAHP